MSKGSALEREVALEAKGQGYGGQSAAITTIGLPGMHLSPFQLLCYLLVLSAASISLCVFSPSLFSFILSFLMSLILIFSPVAHASGLC
jgi:hypothetical protein